MQPDGLTHGLSVKKNIEKQERRHSNDCTISIHSTNSNSNSNSNNSSLIG